MLSPSLALAGNAVPLTPTTITATRTEQAVDSVPSTVSVQTREQLDRQNVNNIKELVRYEPGVSVGGAGQRAGITGYNIRGIDGNRILTQIDGVELAYTHVIRTREYEGQDGLSEFGSVNLRFKF